MITLLELMRGYGVHEKIVGLVERIYNGSMVKFEMDDITTDGARVIMWLCRTVDPYHLSFLTFMSENLGK